jgi:hypothetical protein
MHGTNDFNKLSTWINSLSNLISVSYSTPLEKCIESIQKVEDSPYPLFNTLLPLFSYTDKNKELFNNSILYSKYLLASELKTVKKLPNNEGQAIVDEFDRNHDDWANVLMPAELIAANRLARGVIGGAGGFDALGNRQGVDRFQWVVPERLRPDDHHWADYNVHVRAQVPQPEVAVREEDAIAERRREHPRAVDNILARLNAQQQRAEGGR